MYMNLRLISTSILLFTLVESIPLTADSCQKLQCHPLTEICRRNSSCSNESHPCYSCFRKSHLQRLPSLNSTVDPSFYDDYYEYDEDDHLEDNDEFSGKIDLQDYQDYLEDYVEPFDQGKPIRKLGTCPKVVDALGPCDQANIVQPDCRFDTECPGDLKCCAAACGKRTCTTPVQAPLSNCPQSFQCSLNCRLGYRVDSKGCLLCECQSCPSMEQCQKSCPSGYLKDLFNCDMCECRDQCPPFACRIVCPANVGFAKSETGCPLCQCATSSVASIASNSSCEKDVHCPVGFRCVTDARHVPMCQAVSSDSDVSACSPMKCPTGCDTVIRDVNGCPTCQCRPAQCSRVMCRMYCVHGFKRDAKGCEICACNDSPQPCPPLACEQTCQKYRKDYSGCPTCDCDCPATDCAPTLNCTNGLKTGPDGCPKCSCNEVQEKKPGDSSCPKTRCRMFCMYGFRRNEQGCEMCECDWSPIAENIQCSERIPCPGTRVCNLNLKLCEIVDQDRVNWFLYDFELKSDLLKDQEFMKTFKTGLIHNIAKKYNLKTSQITVSKVEPTGSTSFQIMPYYDENMDDFQDKIDQIDSDLNSHEFRAVLPAIVDVISDNSTPATGSVFDRFRNQWYRYTAGRRRFIVYTFAFLFATAVVLLTVMIGKLLFQKRSYKNLRDSNSPIYDTPYHMAPTDEDHDHSLHSADGAWSINVPGDDLVATSDKRHLVR